MEFLQSNVTSGSALLLPTIKALFTFLITKLNCKVYIFLREILTLYNFEQLFWITAHPTNA